MIETLVHPKVKLIPVDFDPFAGSAIEKVAPSTESQKEIWASCIIGGADANRAYNESITLHFKGYLDKDAFEQALQSLIERNESLRTTFSADGKQLCISVKLPIELSYKDLSEIPEPVAKRIVKSYIKQDALFLFSLTDGPLIKTGLFKLNSNEHKFVLTTHHIICDGWSIGILLQDLSKLYSSYTQNTTPDLPHAPLFSAYAFEHQEFINSKDYQHQEDFWLNNLKDNTPLVKLPADFERPLFRTYKSARLDFPVKPELIAELKANGIKNGCSLVITLTAAFELFLQRLTGNDDIILGLPAADQSASGNTRLIGHCVNLLPLKSQPNPEVKFSDFLKERRNYMFDAYEHQRITFGSLLKKLKVSRDTALVPLIPVVFNIDMGLTDGVNFYGMDFSFVNNPRQYESFEIFLNVTGSEKSFILEWSYNTQLFKPESIQRMMAGFETILKTVAAKPDVLLKDILLTDKQQLLSEIDRRNETEVSYPTNKRLIQLIAETAVEKADSVALVYGQKQLTFKELNQKANHLARYLLKKNIGVGDVIGLAVKRSPEMIIALLGILKTGATFLPIDTELPPDRINFMLSDSAAKAIFTSKKPGAIVSSQSQELIIEEVLAQVGTEIDTDPEVEISESDIAYIIYTSGSTGKPKGVLIQQRSILNYIQSSIAVYSSDSENAGSFIHLALSFDASLTAVFVPLVTGKAIVISTEAALQVFDDDNLVKFAPFDFIKLTPAQLTLLSNSKNQQVKFAAKKLIVGGEALLKRHIDFLIEHQVNVEIVNEYGPTEATVGCVWYTFNPLKDFQNSPTGISIGKPMPNVKIYILDKYLNPVPDGLEGELYIGGVQLASGYLNNRQLSEEKFIQNPYNKTERLYRTGDLAKYATDGDITYLGRIDTQFKIRGYRIEPGEIEQLLMKQENVAEALVIAREDRAGDQRMAAYIVTTADISAEQFTQEINDWKIALKGQFPAYMCPADYVNLPAIPLTVNGKIDVAKLPKPTIGKGDLKAAQIAPQTETEMLVAGIWENILGVGTININDDFFEIGGHSLLAIEAMAQLVKQTGRVLQVSALLEHPTVYKLALFLDGNSAANRWKSLVAIKPSGKKHPFYIVHGAGLGVWFFNDVAPHLHPEQPVYGLQGLGIDGLDEPFETVEQTAAFYLSEMIQQNPDGPYFIAGFSDGGLIAFEMAQQLKAMGKEVAMLGMLDTFIREKDFQSIVDQGIRHLRRINHVIKSLFKNPRKALEFQRMCFRLRVYTFLKRFGYIDKKSIEVRQPKLFAAMTKYTVSLGKYKRKTYEGAIDLFRSKVRVYYIDDLGFLGWKPYTTKEILIHEVPGDHDDMTLVKNAPAFAAILQKVIDDKVI